MRLKQLASVLILSTLLLNAADNSALLSTLKQDKLDIDKKKNELESDNLKYDWIEQIKGSYSYTNSGVSGETKETNLFSVTLDQPIFKSGGIYYGIQYSGANREFLRLTTKLNEQTLVKSAILALLNIKKLDFQIQRQNALIENAKIDIMRKKEQYESGLIDSSFLDTAILNKNGYGKALIDMQSSRYSALMNFKSISDFEYSSIIPPSFTMLEKSDYLDKSLIIKQQDMNSKKAEHLKEMTIANYLPTVSLFAGYYDSSIKQGGIDENYNTFGVKISMPLIDVNRGRTIEVKQLEYMKSKLELADTKIQESNIYQDYVKKIEFLNKKIDLAVNDANLYDSLLFSTKELFKAGEKTIYDVNTLEYSQKTMILDKKIYEVDVQLALLELYAKMSGEI
jgi:outer membrane protein TolC